jgi:hypothetical protein
VSLAMNPAGLTELRATLRNRLAQSPICDVASYGRRWEKAISELWTRWCEANPLDPFIGYTGPS